MAFGFLGDIIGDIASSLYGSLPTQITDLYTQPLPQLTSPDITFQPFTVTGPGGSQVTTTADGSTSYALSPEQQAMQQALFGGAQSMFQGAMAPTADREAAIYDRMRAAQMPEEARQRAALEERLAAQGRLGVRTNQFGGTPEQLALAKAQAEAQNTAMLGAMQQAQAEQAQQAQLGGQFLQQSYAPQAALLSMMSPALNVAGLADVARRQQGEFDLETALANLQGLVGQQAGLGSLYGNMFTGATGLAGGFGQGLLDILGF
jgi:hypothetical protein